MIKRYFISQLDDLESTQVIIVGQVIQIKADMTSLIIDDHTSTIECDVYNNNTIQFTLGQHIKLLGEFYQKKVFGGALNKIKIQKFSVISSDEAALHVIEIECQNKLLSKKLKQQIEVPFSQGVQVNEQRKQVELQTTLVKYMYMETQIVHIFSQSMYCLAQNMEISLSDSQVNKLKIIFNLDQLYNEIQYMLVEWNMNESKLMIQARVKDALLQLCKTKHIVTKKENQYELHVKENLEFFYITMKKIQANKSLKIKQITQEMNKSYEGFISQISDPQSSKNPTLFSEQLFHYITNILIEKHLLLENGPGKVSCVDHFYNLDKQFEHFILHIQSQK